MIAEVFRELRENSVLLFVLRNFTIGREFTFQINRYLLRGNWEKELPSDGRAPSTWLGSAEIIDEFSKTKRPVKYAQCWVYASVFVTSKPWKTTTTFLPPNILQFCEPLEYPAGP